MEGTYAKCETASELILACDHIRTCHFVKHECRFLFTLCG